MAGITGYGAKIPYFRLEKKKIGEAWGSYGAGEKAVASHDEDSVSLAVAAVVDCGKGAVDADCLYLATTTGPYGEKGSASTIAMALGLKKDVRTMDITGSLKGGMSGMLTGLEQAESGIKTLVAMSDCRLGAPQGPHEQVLGDGAAAFVLGNDDIIAELEASESANQEVMAYWRSSTDRFLQTGEDRFASTKYVEILMAAMGNFAKQTGATIKDFDKVVLDAPSAKLHKLTARMLKVSPEQLVKGMYDSIGHTGCANVGLMLVSALSNAEPGERILVAAFGEGCHIAAFKVTEKIVSFKPKRPLKEQLANKDNSVRYTDYLKWRGIIETEPPRRPAVPKPSQPALYRGYDQNLGFIGSRCKKCGTPQFPKQRVCVHCRAKDEMEDYSFKNKTARLATYTVDYLAASVAPPTVIGVVDFQGGGRMLAEVTDCRPEQMRIGMELDFCFRRLQVADGISNYFWKAVPKRGGTND